MSYIRNCTQPQNNPKEAVFTKPANTGTNARADTRAINKVLEIIIAVGMILAFPIVMPISWGYKLYTHLKTKAIVQKLAMNRRTAVLNTIEEKNEVSKNHPLHFQIKKIIQLLQISHGDMDVSMQKVREKISKTIETKYYQEHKCEKNDPAIKLIHAAAHALVAQSTGMSETRNYGAKIHEKWPNEEKTLTGLIDILDRSIYKYDGFVKTTIYGNLFWMYAHPIKAMNSFLGHSTKYNYNSYNHGNVNLKIGTLTHKGKTLHFSFGPGPTGDRIFEGHLQHLKNEKQVHLQHDLQYAGVPSEHKRRLKQKDWEKEYDSLRFMSTPLDGKIWKSKDEFKEISTVEQFSKKLKEHVMNGMRDMPKNGKEDTSFYLPENLFLKNEIDTLFNSYKEIFSPLENSTRWKTSSSQHKNKALLLAFDTLLAIHAITKTMKNSKEKNIYFGQACKQDIDRGVILNVMTILSLNFMAEKTLDEKLMNELIGSVHLRAKLVDNRSILHKRYEALSNLLHMIKENPLQFQNGLINAFGKLDNGFDIL